MLRYLHEWYQNHYVLFIIACFNDMLRVYEDPKVVLHNSRFEPFFPVAFPAFVHVLLESQYALGLQRGLVAHGFNLFRKGEKTSSFRKDFQGLPRLVADCIQKLTDLLFIKIPQDLRGKSRLYQVNYCKSLIKKVRHLVQVANNFAQSRRCEKEIWKDWDSKSDSNRCSKRPRPECADTLRKSIGKSLCGHGNCPPVSSIKQRLKMDKLRACPDEQRRGWW